MPRARINDAEEDVVMPKPRARKPRAVSVDGEVVPVARKRAPARPKMVTVVSEPVSRKAPTPLAQKRRIKSKNTKAFFGVLGVCLLVAGIGIGIGMMDGGEIDVVAVVNERNEKINKGEVRDEAGNTITQTVQVQTDTRPNGGLPMGEAVTPPPLPEVSSTTEATTTAETASSTESIEDSADADEEATSTAESV